MLVLGQIVDAAEEIDRKQVRDGDVALLCARHACQVKRHADGLSGFDFLGDGVATFGVWHTDGHGRRRFSGIALARHLDIHFGVAHGLGDGRLDDDQALAVAVDLHRGGQSADDIKVLIVELHLQRLVLHRGCLHLHLEVEFVAGSHHTRCRGIEVDGVEDLHLFLS